MTNKFTQQELEEAFQQMQADRNAEYNNAVEAAKWLQAQIGVGHCHLDMDRFQSMMTTPYSARINLKLIHETYGPYMDQYTDFFDKATFATKVGNAYEVDTPFGKFGITFEYFDNHCTGY